MDFIDLYKDVDKLRDMIWNFNVYLFKKEKDTVLKFSIAVLEQLISRDIEDESFHLSDQEIDYWKEYFIKFRKAVKAGDDLYLYDCFNVDLKELSYRLFNILWKEHEDKLNEFFWKENADALKIRYPDILKRIETSQGQNDILGTREYGMRGRVIYLRGEMSEYDLFSEYNPNDFSYQLLNQYDFNKYKKIYIWSLGGDYDIGVLFQMSENVQANLEVYIASVEVFGKFLHSTFRKGVLSEQRINYIFDRTIDDFLIDIAAEDDVYVYIGAYSLERTDEKRKIEKFLSGKQIDNNIVGEKYEEYFVFEQKVGRYSE